jgi:hypothetical protein
MDQKPKIFFSKDFHSNFYFAGLVKNTATYSKVYSFVCFYEVLKILQVEVLNDKYMDLGWSGEIS